MTARPILVTGMPRSGTTWLARELARSPRTALTGREPMNARGRQYALGGTLSGWTRLANPSRHQAALLDRAYRGLNPMVYSRYGHHQWAAPLPWIRVIVKDPFAMLSLPAVSRVTGASVIVVYRHPGAVLASFRRMGWAPDPPELEALEALTGRPARSRLTRADDLSLVGRMWTLLHSVMLADLSELPHAVVVSHEHVARGGERALGALCSHLGLKPPGAVAVSDSPQREVSQVVDPAKLHNFNRDPRVVADAWRETVSTSELAELEGMTGEILASVQERQFDVG